MLKEIAHGLELQENIPFQNRERRVQRVFWMLLCAGLVAAVFGVFGNGFLSEAEKGNRTEGLGAKYERFLSYDTASSLIVTLKGRAAKEPGLSSVGFNQSYLEAMEVESIVPAPAREEGSSAGVTYFFHAPREETQKVLFRVRPREIGRVRLELTGVGGESLQLTHFVYP